jgi:hypothetical protein
MSRVIALLLAIFGTMSLFAQSVGTAGTIEGTVLDPSGAVVQLTHVTLSNDFMNYTAVSTTDEKVSSTSRIFLPIAITWL